MADKLEAKLGLNLDEFSKGLGDAKGIAKDFGKEFVGDFMSVGAAVAGVTEFFKKLTDVWRESDTGARAYNATLAMMDQYLYDIANKKKLFLGGGLVGIGVSLFSDKDNIIAANKNAKERADLEKKERQDRLDQKDIELELQKALYKSYSTTGKEQKDAILKVIDLNIGLATMKNISNKEWQEQVKKELKTAEDKTVLLNEQNRLKLEEKDIEKSLYELTRQRGRLTSIDKADQKDIADALREQGQYLSTGYKTDTINTKNTSFGSLQMSNGTNWWEGLGLPYKASIDKKNASATPAQIEEATNAIKDQEQSVAALGKRFGQLFSGVNMGFQGMVDGMITGLKRLVMELIAEAAFLAILAAFGVIPISSIPTILGSMHGIKPGGIKGNPGGGAGVGVTPSIGMGQSNVTFEISGKSLVGVLKRN